MNSDAQQLVHLVLTLARNGGLATLSSVIAGEKLLLAKELKSLVETFEFTQSVAFEELTKGKSASVVSALKRKFSEPAKSMELKEEFYGQVRRLLDGGEVLKYLPSSSASRVDAIRIKLEAMNAR